MTLETKNMQNSNGFLIVKRYHKFLDNHVKELLDGNVEEFFTLKQISKELAISHQHLSETVKKISGFTPCYFYDQKIIQEAQKMLSETEVPVVEIARRLTYDASNFSKFFKKWTGTTPGRFRKEKSDR